MNGESDSWKPLDDFLDGLVAQKIVPGYSCLVCNASQVIYFRFGGSRQVVPTTLPVTSDTSYDLASLTKVVATTMLATKLEETGMLSYDWNIGRFFADSGNYGSVTIRQLLTHCGGFISEMRLWDHMDDPDQAIPFILSNPPIARPGEVYEYSCFGFIILGEILQRIASQRLDLLAEEMVFHPLGMDHTTFHPIGDCAATEWDTTSSQVLCKVVHDENARFLGGVAGNAGLFAPASDIGILAQMLLAEGEGLKGRFLSSQTIRLMGSDLIPWSGTGRGIGFLLGSRGNTPAGKIATPASYGHTGFTGTSIWLDPNRECAAVLLTNRVHPSRNEQRLLALRPAFHDLVFTLSDSLGYTSAKRRSI